ncbi:hypothetical protein FJT64_017850 [Amphibalanus amphitrite]|uniref:Uncharacterized protein n=1 Tax=Amphibalanus amphitrite TaxID=1232801 RepID=A0A6A4WWN1_AMPAM|nr:hypothetical protein FJT64_017850 [Amphibalanus amphitrite]
MVPKWCVLLVLLVVTVVPAAAEWDEEEEHHEQHHHQHIDLEHREEHADDDIFQTLGEDEEQHDADHNSALDGLELMASLFHVNPYHVTHLTSEATEEQVRQAAINDADYNARLLNAIAGE